MNFPTPGFVFGIFRKEGGGACNCLKEDVDADGEIRTVNESSSTRENGFVDRGESLEPAGSAANRADAKRSEAAEIVGRGTGSCEFHGNVDAAHGFAAYRGIMKIICSSEFGAHIEAVFRREMFDEAAHLSVTHESWRRAPRSCVRGECFLDR